MTRLFIGIDPGADGALVGLPEDRDEEPVRHRLPMAVVGSKRRLDAYAFVSVLRLLMSGNESLCVVVEAPSVRPGEGAQGALGVGLMHGAIRGILVGLGVQWRDVQPQVWRRGVGLPQSSDRAQRKHDAIRLAEQLVPDVWLVYSGCRKPHDGTADAALMALWARSQAW